jgi:hypothetical protein
MYQEEGTLKNWIKMFPAPISVVYGNVFWYNPEHE